MNPAVAKLWPVDGWAKGQMVSRAAQLQGLPERVCALLAYDWILDASESLSLRYPGVEIKRLVGQVAGYGLTGIISEQPVLSCLLADTDFYAIRSACEAIGSDLSPRLTTGLSQSQAFASVANYVSYKNPDQKWNWAYRLYRNARGPGIKFLPEWRTRDVTGMVTAIVNSRDFSTFPILADALQDAGCEHHELLRSLQEDIHAWGLSNWVIWNTLRIGEEEKT